MFMGQTAGTITTSATSGLLYRNMRRLCELRKREENQKGTAS